MKVLKFKGMNDILNNITNALSSMNLWIAVAKSILIILVGFLFGKLKLLPQETDKTLNKVALTITLPCLAFASFMTEINQETFMSCLFTFIYGFFIYILFIFVSKLLFLYEKNLDTRQTLEMLFVFGSTTFFAQPLIQAIYPQAYNDSSMFNIPFRVFLYSYCYYEMCIKKNYHEQNEGVLNDLDNNSNKVKPFKVFLKIFKNPIIIATFLGFIFWSLQLIGNDKDLNNWWVINQNGNIGAFWNIKISLPWFYETINTLGNLTSPLVWLSIGVTLGNVPFKDATFDKNVWIYSGYKLLLQPLVNIGLLLLITLIPGVNVTTSTLISTTLMWMVPPGAVVTSYAIISGKGAKIASSTTLISTIIAIILIPLYVIILSILASTGLFS